MDPLFKLGLARHDHDLITRAAGRKPAVQASHGATDEEREGGGGGDVELVGAAGGRAGGDRGAAPAGGRRVDEPPDLFLRLPRLLPTHHPPDPALPVGNESLARSLPSTTASNNHPDALLFP